MILQNRTSRFAINAVMIAVYVVLSLCVIPFGGLKITFEHFPVVLCAVLYGPLDAIIVGGIGEFINQMTTFGFTPTTLLWILPIVCRGFCMGMCKKIFVKHMKPVQIIQQKIPFVFVATCICSGILSSILNTLALYVDSKMFGYYSFAMVFGALAARILLSVLTSIIICCAIKPILHALSHAHLV